jgi:predicted transcriptional regulator
MSDNWTEASGLSDLLEEKAEESRSCEEQDRRGDASVPRLFNAGRPMYENKKEKYIHRIVAFMLAEGHTNKEIADTLELSPVTVNYYAKQKFVEEMVLGKIHENGDKTLEVLAAESLAAAERLIELAKTAENDEVRRKANNDILDRKYGKPNQPMSVRNVSPEEVSDAELVKALKQN